MLIVTVWVLVSPTATLPKLTLVGTTEIRGCAPTALSEITVGEFGASLASETLPVTLLATEGRKVIAKALDWLGPSVNGSASPLTAKPLPTTVACEMLTLPVPELRSETVWALLLPSSTLPKLMLDGLAERTIVGCTPLPDREIEDGDIRALLDRVKLPVEVPTAAGANVTLMLTD